MSYFHITYAVKEMEFSFAISLETSSITISCICKCSDDGQEGVVYTDGVPVGQDMGHNPILHIVVITLL